MLTIAITGGNLIRADGLLSRTEICDESVESSEEGGVTLLNVRQADIADRVSHNPFSISHHSTIDRRATSP